MSFVLGDIRLMPIPDGPPHYQVYVLRCWEEHSDQPESVAWRFSVQDPDANQRRGFASLEALVAFLTNQFGAWGIKCKVDDNQE
jgi:hypothetical protein